MYLERVARLLYRQGTDSLRQLRYAIMDLALYSSYVPRANATVEESPLYKEVISNTTVLPRLEEDKCADMAGLRVWNSCADEQPR
jgi:Zn-dependent oligopeptidase